MNAELVQVIDGALGMPSQEEIYREIIECAKSLEVLARNEIGTPNNPTITDLPYGKECLESAEAFELERMAGFAALAKQSDVMKFFSFIYSCAYCRWLVGEIDDKGLQDAVDAMRSLFEISSGFDKKHLAPIIFRVHRKYAEDAICPQPQRQPKPNSTDQTTDPWLEADENLSCVDEGGETDDREVVYFVQNPSSKKIKIGYSTGFKARLRALECGAGEVLDVLLIVDGTRETEASLHQRFQSFRQRGEWFAPEEPLVSFISRAKETIGRSRIGASERQVVGLLDIGGVA